MGRGGTSVTVLASMSSHTNIFQCWCLLGPLLCWGGCLSPLLLLSAVIISRQQRRVQLMRIKQREERKEKKKKRRPHPHPHLQHKAHPPEPAYRRKPNPVRRFDGDVLSPVSECQCPPTQGQGSGALCVGGVGATTPLQRTHQSGRSGETD